MMSIKILSYIVAIFAFNCVNLAHAGNEVKVIAAEDNERAPITPTAVHAAERTNVVMLGDSTTLCKNNKLGAKLTDYVQSYLTQQNLQVKVVNSGVGGSTARQGHARLQGAVLAHDPRVVTISFGLNDTGKLTPKQYRECMEKILQKIQKNSQAKILLITSTPFNNDRHMWKEKFEAKGGLDEYMDNNICAAVRTLAKKYNIPLCDLHAHFVDQFKKSPRLIDELILPDGVHLTDQGNEVAAKYVAPFIAELLTQSDKPQPTFLYPGGHTKAYLFSMDDGFVSDRKMIGILNKYKLRMKKRGQTFKLNG
jgi:lysophospholipase L1-like esterase